MSDADERAGQWLGAHLRSKRDAKADPRLVAALLGQPEPREQGEQPGDDEPHPPAGGSA